MRLHLFIPRREEKEAPLSALTSLYSQKLSSGAIIIVNSPVSFSFFPPPQCPACLWSFHYSLAPEEGEEKE